MKIDLKKELKNIYNTTKKDPYIIEIPEFNYICVDGSGDPNNSEMFQNYMEALFGISYAIKFMLKKEEKYDDYSVMPVEGQWWSPNMETFSMKDKNSWLWTLMIMQPNFITEEIFNAGMIEVKKKKDNPLLDKLYYTKMTDGLSAQILHIGPYSEEEPTIKRLHDFIHENGYKFRGKHREMYLGDPRKSAPEKLKTILRQPIEKV